MGDSDTNVSYIMFFKLSLLKRQGYCPRCFDLYDKIMQEKIARLLHTFLVTTSYHIKHFCLFNAILVHSFHLSNDITNT